MTGMFPGSGVPPSDAKNSLPNPDTQNCDELWYSTSRCQPRFDPEAANAMLAELINLINKGEVSYDCKYLDQIEHSVRYLIQRGLPRGAVITGADNYTTTLDPTATRYNNLMTLSILPEQDNGGPVKLDVDSLGPRSVLRNDGKDLVQQDMKAGIPMELIYWEPNWYVVGLVKSQIPELKTGEVVGWVRTDGADAPGHDGTENTPEKAFRTIQYAYETLGERYFPTPKLSLRIMLGIPGRYDGAAIGPYGGQVSITGNLSANTSYSIGPMPGAITTGCIQADAVELTVTGVVLVADRYSGNWANMRARKAATVHLVSVAFDLQYSALNGAFISVESGSNLGVDGSFVFTGNGGQLVSAIIAAGGQFLGSNSSTGMNFTNIRFTSGGVYSANLGMASFQSITIAHAGCVGPQYSVTDNSIIRAAGQSLPGNAPGIVTNNGLYFP